MCKIRVILSLSNYSWSHFSLSAIIILVYLTEILEQLF